MVWFDLFNSYVQLTNIVNGIEQNRRPNRCGVYKSVHVNCTLNLSQFLCNINEPPRDKTNRMACVPSKDSDQPGHPPSLIRVFPVRMKKIRVLSYQLSTRQRLWSDWPDAQADLSLCWAHTHFVGFVLSWLNLKNTSNLGLNLWMNEYIFSRRKWRFIPGLGEEQNPRQHGETWYTIYTCLLRR